MPAENQPEFENLSPSDWKLLLDCIKSVKADHLKWHGVSKSKVEKADHWDRYTDLEKLMKKLTTVGGK